MSTLVELLKLPRKLDQAPRDLRGLAERTFYFASDVYDFLRIMRDDSIELRQLIKALQAASGGGGGGPVSFGPPTGLIIGGSNVTGVSTSAARADHVHALANFGTAAGTICEGDDPRLIDVANYRYNFDVDADQAASDPDLSTMTMWDVAGYVSTTFNANAHEYRFAGTGNGSPRAAGRYSTVPGTEFYRTAKVSITSEVNGAAACDIGLFAGDLTNPATGQTYAICLRYTTTTAAPSTLALSFGSYSSGGASLANAQQFCPYVRMRVNTGAPLISFDVSPDGHSWRYLTGAVFTALHYGYIYRSTTAAARPVARVHWIDGANVAGSSAFDYERPGALVRYPLV
jgi:hypothetical protein